MESNSSGLWRTIAMASIGLLFGLGGSFVTVEIRLAQIRADLEYLTRDMGDLRGVSKGMLGDIQTMRYTLKDLEYRTNALTQSQTRLEALLHNLEGTIAQWQNPKSKTWRSGDGP